MFRSEVLFFREKLHGVTLPASTLGPVSIDYEVITGLQHNGRSLSFQHFQYPGPYVRSEPMEPKTVRMPKQMSQRVAEFCMATYMDGNPDFNCYSFVGYTLGWQKDASKPPKHQYFGSPISSQEDTVANKPYVVHAPDTTLDGNPIVHALLGEERTGYSLNVIGPEKPLAFVKNSDVMRLYGAAALVAVHSRELLD